MDRPYQRDRAQEIEDPFEVVGQYVETHLGTHVGQRPGEEMGRTHPGLERAEGVLRRLAADPHRVWLGIETVADNGPVARYERCALVASRGPVPGHSADIPGPSEPAPFDEVAQLVPSWDLGSLPSTDWPIGETRTDAMRDHVDLAPSLARMTFNQAFVHRDATTSIYGKRLVYGGHVQGLAQSSLSRVLPGIATIVSWDGCDHIGPAFEGDLLEFRHTLTEERPVDGGRLLRFEVRAATVDDQGQVGNDILVWTPVVFSA